MSSGESSIEQRPDTRCMCVCVCLLTVVCVCPSFGVFCVWGGGRGLLILMSMYSAVSLTLLANSAV